MLRVLGCVVAVDGGGGNGQRFASRACLVVSILVVWRPLCVCVCVCGAYSRNKQGIVRATLFHDQEVDVVEREGRQLVVRI